MTAATAKQMRRWRAAWAATIVCLMLSSAAGLALMHYPSLWLPAIGMLCITALLWLASVLFLQKFDRYLGALAIGLCIGGGAIGRGVADMDKPGLWIWVVGLTISSLQALVLAQALLQSRNSGQ